MNLRKYLAISLVPLFLTACSPEQKEASKLGFANTDEMHDIQAQGWHTKSQYLIDENAAARKLGFADFDEMQSARKAGYADKVSWAKHLASSSAVKPAPENAGDTKAQASSEQAAAPSATTPQPTSGPKLSGLQARQALVAHFGPGGWARCVAGDVAVSAMIIRGDPIKNDFVGEHEEIGPVLEAMHDQMLAQNIPQSYLDKLIKVSSDQLLSSADPALQALKTLDGCYGEVKSVLSGA